MAVLTSFSQEKIYVPFFNCEGCNRQSGNSVSLIFANFINEKGNFETILAHSRDSVFEKESFNEARESAELNSAKYFIMGTMIKLESIYYLKITLHATSSGLNIWSTSRQIDELQDIPAVLKDIASKMGSDNKKSLAGDIYLVSKSEAKKVNRIKSNKSLGFITGAMVPLSEKKVNNINPGFGGLLSFDLRNFILETSAEVYFANDSLYDGNSYDEVSNRYYNFMINAIYPLSTKNSAPFLSLASGFSYRESEVKYNPVAPGMPASDNKYDQGLMVNGGVGYMLKRNTDATLFIYTRAYVYMPDFDTFIYGVMLSFAVHVEGW